MCRSISNWFIDGIYIYMLKFTHKFKQMFTYTANYPLSAGYNWTDNILQQKELNRIQEPYFHFIFFYILILFYFLIGQNLRCGYQAFWFPTTVHRHRIGEVKTTFSYCLLQGKCFKKIEITHCKKYFTIISNKNHIIVFKNVAHEYAW